MAKTGMKSAFKMGEGKTASVILPTKFTTANTANAKGFQYGNLLKEYATDETKIEAYADRLDAIDLNDGLCPVFNSDSLNLSPEEFEQTYQDLNMAQANGNNLYSMAFSFRGDWLVENNLYDPETGEVNQHALKRAEQDVVKDIFDKAFPSPLGEDKDDVVWFGVIHHDTDHLNMHLWFAKKSPETRPEMIHQNGEPTGKIDRKVIQQANRKLQTNLESPERRERRTELFKNIEVQKKNTKLHFAKKMENPDNKLSASLQEVWDALPDSTRGRWQVGPGTLTSGNDISPMSKPNKALDKLITNVLETDFKDELTQFMKDGSEIDRLNEEMYGAVPNGKQKWSENKLDQLKKDIGNEIYREFNRQAKENPEQGFDAKAFGEKFKDLNDKKDGMKRLFEKSGANQPKKPSFKKSGHSNFFRGIIGPRMKNANEEAQLTKKAMRKIEQELAERDDEMQQGSSFSR